MLDLLTSQIVLQSIAGIVRVHSVHGASKTVVTMRTLMSPCVLGEPSYVMRVCCLMVVLETITVRLRRGATHFELMLLF